MAFTGNTAIACDHGFQIEATNFDGQDLPANYGQPPPTAWYPRDSTGKAATIYIEYFTAHHNRFRGLWARAQHCHVRFSTFAENMEDIQLAGTGDMPAPGLQYFTDSLIVGWTDNNGEKLLDNYQGWNDAKQRSWPRNGIPMVGVAVYDGPQSFERITFRNYDTASTETAHSAIGTRFNGLFQISTTTSYKSCIFEDVTRKVYVSDRTGDGGKGFNLRDDGCISGSPATILTDWGFYKTPNCRTSVAYGVACPHRYAQLWAIDMSTTSPTNNKLSLTRNNHADSAHTNYAITYTGFFSGGRWRYQPIVSIGASYLVQFKSFAPKKTVFQLNNAELGQSVSLAICYPKGTTFNSVKRGYNNAGGSTTLPSATSTTNVAIPAASTRTSSTVLSGSAYYWDSNRGILSVTIAQRQDRTDFGSFCPSGGCDVLWVDANIPAGAVITDCTNSAYSGDSHQITGGTWLATKF
jgi:hypothetical protein